MFTQPTWIVTPNGKGFYNRFHMHWKYLLPIKWIEVNKTKSKTTFITKVLKFFKYSFKVQAYLLTNQLILKHKCARLATCLLKLHTRVNFKKLIHMILVQDPRNI